jgi:hypothetical protein
MQKSVPATSELDHKALGFRKEIVSAFIQERRLLETSSHHILSPDEVPGKKTCVSGRGGEAFIDTGHKAYQGSNPLIHSVITNAGCGQPCLLNQGGLADCNLNPGPFKRLMWAILVEAWKVNHKFAKPMQPDTLLITCDAFVVGDLTWAPLRLTKFVEPPPNDTLEATIIWLFLEMEIYTGRRMGSFCRSIALGNLDTLKKVLLCPQSIDKEFQLSRSKDWTLEQMCFIIDSVTEEPFLFCRDDHRVESDEEDVHCFVSKKRKRINNPKEKAATVLKPQKRARQKNGEGRASGSFTQTK